MLVRQEAGLDHLDVVHPCLFDLRLQGCEHDRRDVHRNHSRTPGGGGDRELPGTGPDVDDDRVGLQPGSSSACATASAALLVNPYPIVSPMPSKRRPARAIAPSASASRSGGRDAAVRVAEISRTGSRPSRAKHNPFSSRPASRGTGPAGIVRR